MTNCCAKYAAEGTWIFLGDIKSFLADRFLLFVWTMLNKFRLLVKQHCLQVMPTIWQLVQMIGDLKIGDGA